MKSNYNTFTIRDALNERNIICEYKNNIKSDNPFIKSLTWEKTRNIIKDNINDQMYYNQLEKAYKLSILLSKCPFRKRF